jgi:excisionase family DNA binding protein
MLTVREVAAILGLNPKTVYARWRDLRGQRFGRAIRIPEDVVASLVEQGRVVPSGGQDGGSTRR